MRPGRHKKYPRDANVFPVPLPSFSETHNFYRLHIDGFTIQQVGLETPLFYRVHGSIGQQRIAFDNHGIRNVTIRLNFIGFRLCCAACLQGHQA